MAPGSDRMAPDFHIVGWIEESGVDPRIPTDDTLQKFGIATIATSHPVIAENPDIARLRSWCCRNRRDNLVLRIGGRCENHIDLAGREAGQSRVNFDIERSEFA